MIDTHTYIHEHVHGSQDSCLYQQLLPPAYSAHGCCCPHVCAVAAAHIYICTAGAPYAAPPDIAGAAGAGVGGAAASGIWRSLTRCCLIWLSVGCLATSPLDLLAHTDRHRQDRQAGQDRKVRHAYRICCMCDKATQLIATNDSQRGLSKQQHNHHQLAAGIRQPDRAHTRNNSCVH